MSRKSIVLTGEVHIDTVVEYFYNQFGIKDVLLRSSDRGNWLIKKDQYSTESSIPMSERDLAILLAKFANKIIADTKGSP